MSNNGRVGYGIPDGEDVYRELIEIRQLLDQLFMGENRSYDTMRSDVQVSITSDEMDVNQELLRQAENKALACVDSLIAVTDNNNRIAHETIASTSAIVRAYQG